MKNESFINSTDAMWAWLAGAIENRPSAFTRELMFLAAIGGDKSPLPEPLSHKESYMVKFADRVNSLKESNERLQIENMDLHTENEDLRRQLDELQNNA